ncbi:YihY family inner membrane protein [Oceanobacter kriegii]|uniref:YihY family inner membrane protein n=1 Tax=Oceanobacter kriegii TaxID=64972 RepID=UPI0009FF608E|nr:YihY family inner membrane protein [Oceanobacter kriegii]
MLTAFRRGRRVLTLIWQTLQRFESMERRRDAAALTYTTLFALVPVITVTYSILSAIPALQEWGAQAHASLIGYVMPQGSDTVSRYLVEFSEQARELTWIGIVFLFITALLLLQTIEEQFNRIWQVEVSRSTLQRFFRYWAVLSLGPLLFAAAQAGSSVLASLSLLPDDAGWLGDSVPWAARLVPWSMTAAAITFVYMMVPNCKVPAKDAVIAAVVVATAFETGKFLFARIVGMFPSYQLIYGAFAAVPLFLMWVYISWMLLLFGAELSYALSHPNSRWAGDPLRQRLALAAALRDGQNNGGKGLTDQQLRKRLRHVPAQQLSALLKLFVQQGWVAQTQNDTWVWLPDMRSLTLGAFIADLSLEQITEAQQASDNNAALSDWLQQWQSNVATSLDVTLDQLMNSSKDEQGAPRQ